MKQIDFSRLKIETRIDQYDEIDMREEIGNLLFTRAVTLKEDELARKIYKSDGVILVDDDAYNLLITTMNQSNVLLRVRVAIENAVCDVDEESV